MDTTDALAWSTLVEPLVVDQPANTYPDNDKVLAFNVTDATPLPVCVVGAVPPSAPPPEPEFES
jgi:hypothetical protein